MEQKKVYKSIFMILAMLVFLLSWCSVAHAEENVLLKEMPIEELGGSFDGEWEKKIKDPNGNYCSKNILEIDASESGYVVYDLDGQYTRFSGKMVIDQPYVSVGIYGDGRELYSWGPLTEQAEAWYFDLDVAGVGKLEILSGGTAMFSLENGMLTKAEERAVPSVYTPLREVAVIDSDDFGFGQWVGVTEDINGKVHRGAQWFDTYGETDSEVDALYNLDMKYTSFSGNLEIYGDDDNGSNTKVEIYLDDQLAFEQNGIGRTTEPVEVNLDVTNVKVMKIRVVGKAGYLCVVDDVLKGHDHTPGEWETETEATCDKAGKKVQRCTECKEICNTQETKALGHTPGDWETEIEATCKAEGKRVKYCTVCKKVCAEEKVDKLEHEPGDWEVEAEATCEKAGKKVKHCKVCKEVCEEKTLDKLEHEPGDWEVETEATCWSEGEESVYCKYCGEWLDTREIPIMEHKQEEEWFVQQEPTCTYEGTKVKRCVYCGETIKVEKIPKTKHKFGEWVTVEGSVWNAPIVKTRICSGCFSEETKKVYAWVWVKPVVTLLVILGVLVGIIVILMRQKGIQITVANIKEFCRNGIRDIKDRSKDEASGDDIFGGTKKNEKKDKDDIF